MIHTITTDLSLWQCLRRSKRKNLPVPVLANKAESNHVTCGTPHGTNDSIGGEARESTNQSSPSTGLSGLDTRAHSRGGQRFRTDGFFVVHI